MADGPVADAEAFCRTLEAIARTLPRVEFAAHPALRANARGVDGVAPAVGTDMRAARAFEAVVAGDTSADRPAMTTWYSAGKRHLHQPQLESLAELIAPMVAAAEPPPMTDPRKADGSDARGGAGRGRRAVLELGAGRAVLGRVVSTITGAPLIAVDRRVPKEARVDEDEDWDEHERHRPTLHDGDDDDGKETEEGVAAVEDNPTPAAFAGPARRLVADLTGCSFASLAERANLADVGVGAAVVAKHLCAGATDAAVRLAIEGARTGSGDGPIPNNPRVVGVALAPCCHPQIGYDEYVGKDWLERRWRESSPGARGLGPGGFATLLALLAFAKERVGASDETLMRYHGRALGDVANVVGGAARLRRLGRAARRAIEQGRAEALRTAPGFGDARVCEYVDASVSPDNLVVVAGGRRDPRGTSGSRLPPRGVVVKANSTGSGPHGSLARRLAEFVLERRGRSLRDDDGRGTSEFEYVFTATNATTGGGDGRGGGAKRRRDGSERVDASAGDKGTTSAGDAAPAVVIVGDPARILRSLHLAPSAAPPPPFLAQSLGMLCPFDRRLELSSADGAAVRLAAEVESAARELSRSGDHDDDDDDGRVAVRVSAFPKALEASLVAALQSSDAVRLHPVEFTHVVGAVRWTPGEGEDGDGGNGGNGGSRGDAFLWSIMDRRDWDPRGWRQRVDERAPTPSGATKAERSLAAWLGECRARLPDVLVPPGSSSNERGPRVLIVTDSNAAVEDALVRWARGAARASAVDVARPRKGVDGGWIAETVLDEGRLSGGGDDDDGRGAFLAAGHPSRRANVCVFRVERDLEDVAEALRAGVGSDANSSVLAPGAWAIGQIRLGRRSRHRRANERAAGAFRAKGFTRVRVLHLLSDREHERTLACRVGFG